MKYHCDRGKKPQIAVFCLHESTQKSTHIKLSWCQFNCQVSIATKEMGIVWKEKMSYIDKLDYPGGKFNIGHNLLKVVDNNTGPIL